MKLGKIASKPFNESFKRLMAQTKIPVKTSFKMRSLAKVIAEHAQTHNELKEKYAKEHALLDDKGEPAQEIIGTQTVLKMDLSKMPAFIKKIKELDAIEVEVPSLSLSDLGREEDLTLVPDDYFNLEFLTE